MAGTPEWAPGRVPVVADGTLAIGGYVRTGDPALGAVFVPDGGLFDHPGVSGWVTFRAGVVAERYFVPGQAADPAVPPSLAPPAAIVRPAPAPIQHPAVPSLRAPRPAAADRVRVGDRTYAASTSTAGS